MLEQTKADFAKDDKLTNAAKANDKSLSRSLYGQKFQDVDANRYEKKDKLFMNLFGDEKKMKFIMNMIEKVIFDDLRD